MTEGPKDRSKDQPPLLPIDGNNADATVTENTGWVIRTKKPGEGETIVPIAPHDDEPEKKEWWDH